jgi:hypothetical protein
LSFRFNDESGPPMNDFQLSFEQRERFLYVTGTGIRKNLLDVFESTQAFARILEDTKPKFVLVDYSRLVTFTNNTDVFNITRLYERNAPILLSLCIAIIVNPNEIDINKFWEEICIRRGFNFKIFMSPSDAQGWLLEQIDAEG